MNYLGIEIGGTKLQLGIGLGDGTLRALWRGNVDVARGADGIREQIIGAVPDLLTRAQLRRDQLHGVGIGFGGPVDDSTHTVIKSHQIAGWDGFPLADWISDAVGLPAALGNDADCAGLAEALFGAGKGLSPIFYITIGSGIGGGLIINGEIYRGCGRGAAEIGHLRHITDLANRMRDEPLENSVSGWGIGRLAGNLLQTETRAGRSSKLVRKNPTTITAKEVAAAAAAGDEGARAVLQTAQILLADGICNMIALLCPRRIVIGGGVSLMGEDLLFAPLRQLVAERVFAPFRDCYDIVPAALGEEVVIHGALALARRNENACKVFQKKRSRPVVHAYHVIFSAYGFWLPNDPRGSWSDFVGSWELFRFGRATKTDERRSVAHRPHDRALRLTAKQALKYPPVVFTGRQALAVGVGFKRFAEKAMLTIWACAILPEHVHLVIARPRYRIEQAVNLLKGEATRELFAEELHPLANCRTNQGAVPTCWGGPGWRVYLNDVDDIVRAICYVERNPEKEGLPRQHWSFVTPFTGL